LSSITIQGSITSIGEGAFWNCLALTAITIPASVETIGVNAFYTCSKLTIYVAGYTEKPTGWHNDWNPNGRPVVWGQ
jgi:hypothetical protein